MPVNPALSYVPAQYNPAQPIVPGSDWPTPVWVPCYTAIDWEDTHVDKLATQELLASDLQKSIDKLNKDSVYFPNWAERFGLGLSDQLPDRQRMIEQLKRFSLSMEFRGLCIAVTQHFSNLTMWLHSMSFQPVHEAAGADTRIAGIYNAVVDFESAFTERYLTHAPDDAFFNRLNFTFYEVYQRTCLDILTLGHMALALDFGHQMGDAQCRAWCEKAAHFLLDALDEMSAADGAWTVCEPGMVTKMSDTVRELRRRFFPPQLNGRFCDLRESLFKQAVIELSNQHLSRQVFNIPGNEVHVVNAWRHFLAEELGLEVREADILSGAHLLGNAEQQEKIAQILRLSLAPENLMCVFADQCMDHFANQFADRNGVLDADVFKVAHQTICEVWGELPVNVFVRADEETGAIRLQQDVSLLVGALLDKLVSDQNLPDRIKRDLARLSAGAVSLFDDEPGENNLHQAAANPRLHSFYNAIDRRVVVWIKRTFHSGDQVAHSDYSRVQLSDFSVDLLRAGFTMYPPFLLGEEFSAVQSVLLHGIDAAYMDADEATVEAFASQAGMAYLGLSRLRKWPIERDPMQSHLCIILQMEHNSPFQVSVAGFYQPAWVHRSARFALYVSALQKQNAHLLACMIRNRLVDIHSSLAVQWPDAQLAQHVMPLVRLWVDGGNEENQSDAVHLSLTKLVESPSWRLSEAQRNELRSAMVCAAEKERAGVPLANYAASDFFNQP